MKKLHVKRMGPCPCRSGKPVLFCCLRSNNLVKNTAINPHPGPASNFSNVKCYLSATHDCCDKISKEHYISESVLRLYSTDGRTIRVNGLSWCKGDEYTKVGIGSLVVKSLCERHNNALSNLDTAAKSLIDETMSIDHALNDRNFPGSHLLLSGEDIERWMTKTVIGLHASGNLLIQGKATHLPGDADFTSIILGKAKFPPGAGLHYRSSHGKSELHNAAINIWPHVEKETHEVVGVDFTFSGYKFVLALKPILNVKDIGWRRPRYLEIQSLKTKKKALIEMYWPDGSHESVSIIRDGPFSPSQPII
jgi:hypothetical protein